MLLLLFQLGADTYAIDAGRIAKVLPLVGIKRIPGGAKGIAGAIDYRGGPVPVVDLCELALGRPSRERLSTRVVLAHYPSETDGGPRLLGLIVEKATEMTRRERSDFVDSGVSSAGAPYLGPVASGPNGMIQFMDLGRLLPTSVREALFKDQAAVP